LFLLIERAADASEFFWIGPAASQIGSRERDVTHEVDGAKVRREAIWLLLLASAKFVDLVDEKFADLVDEKLADLVDEKLADLVDEKVEGSRPDNKIQSPRSPWSAPIDEGLTRQMS
jgi:hypothetical protein